jgi:hypothetical protein
MILGVDSGLATFGWALLDDSCCSFVDLGVVIAPKTDDPVTLDRARRCVPHSRLLAKKAQGVSVIVVERMSFPPGAGMNAAVPIALSWGVVIGVHAMLEPSPKLLTIAPQRWQREVLPHAGRAIDYAELAYVAGQHLLRRHPKAWSMLQRIDEKHHNHAIDAAMIALVAALRPHRCEVVEEGWQAAS